jgi:hypothetical protein
MVSFQLLLKTWTLHYGMELPPLHLALAGEVARDSARVRGKLSACSVERSVALYFRCRAATLTRLLRVRPLPPGER